MKLPTYILCALLTALICSCSKSSSETSRALPQSSRGITLSHTETLEEAEALSLAAVAIRQRSPLGTEAAERCWRVEEKRPRLREACLLLWSLGTEDSPFFTEQLPAEALRSRIAAIALIKQARILQKLNGTELVMMLNKLSEEPAWLRAQAVMQWLKTQPRPALPQGYLIWAALRMPASLPDPVSLRWGLRVAQELGLKQETEISASYCQEKAEGVAQIRCWRFLSALIDPASNEGPDRRLISFPPPTHASAWTLFERSYPERAVLLKKFFR